MNNDRITAFLKVKRNCRGRFEDADFDIIFSFRVENMDNDTFIMHKINPHKIKEVLSEGKEFTSLISAEDKLLMRKSVIVKEDDGYFVGKFIEDLQKEDKRLFYRFYFCCDDMGEFEVWHKGNLLTDRGCIYEMSESGAGIVSVLSSGKLSQGDVVDLKSEDINLKVEIVHINRKNTHNLIGGRIIESDTNLINYIIRQYIKVSERIIFEG